MDNYDYYEEHALTEKLSKSQLSIALKDYCPQEATGGSTKQFYIRIFILTLKKKLRLI